MALTWSSKSATSAGVGRYATSVITDDLCHGIRGRVDGPEPATEAEHFEICPECDQAFDCRDLGQVLHHDQSDHEPIRRDA